MHACCCFKPKMNSSQRDGTFKQYGLRSRRPLETIEESDINEIRNRSLSVPDAFDRLLNSPMNRQVSFKPLSHWGKKLAELEKSDYQTKKMKDLYEMSSPDESSPYKKMKKKPKPRKKKENTNLFNEILTNGYKSVKSKQVQMKPRENKKPVDLMKIPLNTIEQYSKKKKLVSSTSNYPIFGLTSTPDKRSHLNEPSFFQFYSPIVTVNNLEKSATINHTPKNSKKNELNNLSKLGVNNSTNRDNDNESGLSNQISENELLANAFSGFSSFAEDPKKCNVSLETSVYSKGEDNLNKISLGVPNQGECRSHVLDSLKEELVSDRNVTLRRKGKRSHEANPNITKITNTVIPTDVNDSIESTSHLPKRKIVCFDNGNTNNHLNLNNIEENANCLAKLEANVCMRRKGKRSQGANPLTDVNSSMECILHLSKRNTASFVNGKTNSQLQLNDVKENTVSPAMSDPINEIIKASAIEIQGKRTAVAAMPYNLLDVKEKKTVANNDLNTEISPYFASESKSSDSSFVMDTPPKQNRQNTILNSLDMTKLHSQSLACLNSTLVLKGGKQHKRGRLISRQFQMGRLTLANTTLVQVPIGRGRGYETFVGELLEMQPDLEGTLLNMTRKSPILQRVATNKTRNTIVKPQDTGALKRITCARQRKSQDFLHLTGCIEKGNNTVHIADKEMPVAGWRCSVRGQRRISRIEKPVSVSIVPDCTVLNQENETTVLRSAFGIHDSSSAYVGETWTEKDAILSRCNQTEPVNFSEHFNELTLPECKKIGEGVYGEVFMYSSTMGTSVFKVIPIEGELLVNDEPQKTFAEIISEIVISMELSNLRYGKEHQSSGYAELRRTWCVQGEYPDFLVELWNDYDMRKGSENDTPTMFSEEQLYVVLELAHGGQDLEAFMFRNAAQSLSAFRQAAFSLAVAERALEFEHRDFHWGNVLVSETTDKYINFALDGRQFQIPSEGVKVTIIDFTLSRITFEGCSVFNDLSVDPSLFTSEGDYQFEIYRMMREETKNNWEQFTPKTNVFWLHYTLDKMLSAVRYSRPKSKPHSTAVRKLRKFKDLVLEFSDSSKLAVSTM